MNYTDSLTESLGPTVLLVCMLLMSPSRVAIMSLNSMLLHTSRLGTDT